MRPCSLASATNGRQQQGATQATRLAATLLIAAMILASPAVSFADPASQPPTAGNEADAKISALVTQIESAITAGNIASTDNPAAASFLSDALSLAPTASPEGAAMIRNLPATLKQRAQQERTQGHWQTGVNFEAFADLVSTMIASNDHAPAKTADIRPAEPPQTPPPAPDPLPGANAPLASQPSTLVQSVTARSPPEAEAPLLPPTPPQRPVAPTQPDTPHAPTLAPTVITELLQRGDSLIAIGDISGARRLYTLAAQNNSAEAALKLGDTYNPGFLAQHGTEGLLPDMKAARTWYQKAAELGDADAKTRIPDLARTH